MRRGIVVSWSNHNCDIGLRYDYDPTTTFDVSCAPASIRRDSTPAKMNMSTFRRSSRVVVVSQSNRTQIVISITSVRRSRIRRGIVVS